MKGSPQWTCGGEKRGRHACSALKSGKGGRSERTLKSTVLIYVNNGDPQNGDPQNGDPQNGDHKIASTLKWR